MKKIGGKQKRKCRKIKEEQKSPNTVNRRLRGRRRYRHYLGSSSEEGAISARAPKKALFRLEQRRRRYLGASSEEGAISARSRWDADSCAEREYYSGEVFANHHKSNHKYSIYLDTFNKDFPTMVTTIRGSRTLRRTQRKRPRNRALSAPNSNSGGLP